MLLRTAVFAALVAFSGIGYAQDAQLSQTREIQKFSLFFEADEIVELELTTDHPDSIRSSRFLRIEFFDGDRLVAGSQFNLARLPIVKITANPTGYGKVEININGHAGNLVPVRNNRIRLFGQVSVSSIERDAETGELILIPDVAGLKGLTNIIDKDGGKRTLTLVTTSVTEPVSN